MSRGTKWRTLATMLATSLLVALLLAEGILRVFWQNPYAGEAPDHMLKVRIQHPHTNHVFDRHNIDPDHPEVRLRTDHRSYILPSHQYPNPDLTIAFFGGSTMANHAVREGLRFHALVSDLLAAEDMKVNTLNVARPGGTLHDSLNILLNHVVLDSPDIAVLMHATNDIGILGRGDGYRTRMGAAVRVSDLGKWGAQILSSRTFLVGLVRKAHGRGLTELPDPDAAERKNDPARPRVPTEPFRMRLRGWIELCGAFGIEPVLMTQPLSSSRNWLTPEWADLGNQDIFNAVIRQVAGETGVPVIDLVRILAEEVPGWADPGRLFWDGMHVNDAGSRVLAGIMTEALRPIARRSLRAKPGPAAPHPE